MTAPFNTNTAVRHPRFGAGQVMLNQGDSVVVRFEHGIEACSGRRPRSSSRVWRREWPPDDPTPRCMSSRESSASAFVRSTTPGASFPDPASPCCRTSSGFASGCSNRGPRDGWWRTTWGLARPSKRASSSRRCCPRGACAGCSSWRPPVWSEQWQVRLREMFDIRTLDLRSRRRYGDFRLLEYPGPGNRLGAYIASRQGRPLGALVRRPALGPRADRRSPSHERGRTGPPHTVLSARGGPARTGQGTVPGAVHRYAASGQGHGIPVTAEAAST